MNMNRRNLVASGLATCVASAFGGPSRAADALSPVRMGVSFKAVNATVINLMIGERLGYAKEEGIELGLVTTGSIGAMLAGISQATFEVCGVTISMMAPLLKKGQLPPITAIYEFTYPYKWDIAVKPELSHQDLRGFAGQEDRCREPGNDDVPGHQNGAEQDRSRSRQRRSMAGCRSRNHVWNRIVEWSDRRAFLLRHRFRPTRNRRNTVPHFAAAEKCPADRGIHDRCAP